MAGVVTPEMIVSTVIWITMLTSSTSTTAASQRLTGNASKTSTSLPSSPPGAGSAAADPLHSPAVFSGCPRACFCNTPSRIVYCSRRGLSSIPDGISADSLQLNLNGNAFESTLIVRRNLSRYIRLEHLYLSECGLESIEVGAFTDLVELQWLDLSNNRLRAIDANAFFGLHLQHLFLNGNRNIRIGPDSFAGLETVGLYLHDCSLSNVDPATLNRLNSTLKYLWLNGNELERVDAQLTSVFSGLMHLRLGSNPLRCDCAAGWLKRFYDRSPEVFKGAVPPTCLTPRSLKARHFNELTEGELRCQAPMFYHVDAKFDVERGVGRLSCTATGEPAPVLYWIQPSGRATKYSPSASAAAAPKGFVIHPSSAPASPAAAAATSTTDRDAVDDDRPGVFEAVLELDASTDYFTRPSSQKQAGGWVSGPHPPQSGMYICVADNEAGNATVTVSLPSPVRPPAISTSGKQNAADSTSAGDESEEFSSLISLFSNPTSTELSNKPPSSRHQPAIAEDDKILEETSIPDVKLDDDVNEIEGDIFVDHVLPPSAGGDRLFTVGELTWAVVGSHVATLALCIALAAGICWRTGRNHSDDVDSSKDVYAFDTPTVADFDLDRRRQHQQQQQRFGGTVSKTEAVAVASSILPAAASKSCVGTVSGTSLYRDRGNPDREEWVRKLLADYRTQQQQQYAPAANGVHPLHHPSVQYQYSTGTYRATDTITTAVSIKR